MSTPPRYFQTEIPYHIYNRGNRKVDIFSGTKDYLRFMKRLKEYKEKFQIELLCFCLLSNHFHFLIRQNTNDAITSFMLGLCTSYSKYFNIKYDLVGRLFQERFRAKIVDTDEYLLHLSRYIHLNAVSSDPTALRVSSRSTPGVERREIIHKALVDYPWSSYREYINNTKDVCDTEIILSYFSKTNPHNTYQSFVEGGIPKHDMQYISKFL